MLWLKETLDAAEITMEKQVLLAAMNDKHIEEYRHLAEEIGRLLNFVLSSVLPILIFLTPCFVGVFYLGLYITEVLQTNQ